MTYQERLVDAFVRSGTKSKRMLANKTQLRPNTVTEAFKRIPSRDVLIKFALALGVSAEWLEYGRCPEKPSLGVMPELLHEKFRIEELSRVINEHVLAGNYKLVAEWAEEIARRVRFVQSAEEKR